jgi:hypothetical protein
MVLLRARQLADPAGPLRAHDRFDALALASLALITIAFFGWTAHAYFLADDFTLLAQAHYPLSWHGVFATRGGDGFFRPVGYVSYVISSKWAGEDPAAWHWIGFLLHLANAVLLYALARLLGYSRFLAWFAATLFAVHGAHPEAVVWIAGRFDLLATFFVLIALLAFVQTRKSDRGQMAWLLVALLATIAGLLSKESAYSFPLLAALLVACAGRAEDGKTWAPVLLFGILTAAVFAYRWNLLGGIGGYGSVSLLPSLKALTFRMWGILFFPINWTLPAGRWLTALAIAYAAVLVRLFMVRAELRRLIFAVGFVLLTAAPAVSQLLIGPDLEKARVLYLPSAGFCLLAASLLAPLRFSSQAPLAAMLLVFHGTILWHNLVGWQRASEVVRTACDTAARCSGRPAVKGLPRTLNGVYTFANGFSECVAMQKEHAGPDPGRSECRFAWDAASGTIKPVQ